MFSSIYDLYLATLIFCGLAQQTENQTISHETQELFQSIIFDDLEQFNKAEGLVSRTVKLPDGQTPLSFAISRSAYAYCPKLVQDKFDVSIKDLERARLMKSLETDIKKQQEADVCIDFIEKALQELGQLPKTLGLRGKEKEPNLAERLTQQMNSADYQLLQATMGNKFTTMHELVERGANPNAEINYTRPLQVAIANTHEEALQYLLSARAKVTQEDIDKAALLVTLIESAAYDSPDMLYTHQPNTHKDQAKANNIDLQRAQRIHVKLKDHMRNQNNDKNPK